MTPVVTPMVVIPPIQTFLCTFEKRCVLDHEFFCTAHLKRLGFSKARNRPNPSTEGGGGLEGTSLVIDAARTFLGSKRSKGPELSHQHPRCRSRIVSVSDADDRASHRIASHRVASRRARSASITAETPD